VELGEAGGGAAAFFLGFGVDGFAGGVVEVAEVLLAEAGAGAAASVGEDVAALEAGLLVVGCWLLVWCVHGLAPSRAVLLKFFKRLGLGSDLVSFVG
jgi:hypothetical protein